MTLYFEEEGEIKLPLECETLAKKVVEEALDYVNCPYEAQVNLLLTENEQRIQRHCPCDRCTVFSDDRLSGTRNI